MLYGSDLAILWRPSRYRPATELSISGTVVKIYVILCLELQVASIRINYNNHFEQIEPNLMLYIYV